MAKRNNPKYAMHVGEESGGIMGHSKELLCHCNHPKTLVYHHHLIHYFTMQGCQKRDLNKSPGASKPIHSCNRQRTIAAKPVLQNLEKHELTFFVRIDPVDSIHHFIAMLSRRYKHSNVKYT